MTLLQAKKQFLQSVRFIHLLSVCCILFYSSTIYAAPFIGFGFGNAQLGLSNYEATPTVRLYAGSRFDSGHGYELEVTQADYSVKGDNVLSAVIRNIVASYTYSYPARSRLGFYGKAGVNFWKAEYQDFGNTVISDDGSSLALGVGVIGDITHRLGIRLEYQHFADVIKTEVTQFTLTGVYNF